jgi:hypothetical protein
VTLKVAESLPAGRRAALEAIRNRLALELDGDAGHRRGCECKCGVPPDARTVPTLAKELREVIREIDDLPEQTGETELDQLAALRTQRQEAARLASAAGS